MSPTTEQLPTELVAKDSTIATWNLVRDSKWSDVKEPLAIEQEPLERRTVSKSEWLSQAELSTCSRSASVLPGSIYLSHQFSFFALGEDYHALIRRLHFDIPVEKIEVRREVEANVYTTGRGESFVSAGSSPQDARAVRSLDEPLASAIFSGLDYSGSSPPVIPMLPNGARPGSFKSAIPIRSVAAGLTEGVNESFGRLSRGIKKVRSPRLIPRPDDGLSGRVPLEFDEEDEAFLSQEELQEHDAGHDNDSGGDNDTMSNSGGRDSRSVSTPSTNNNAPLPGSEPEADEWLDNMDAVEEAERFDEISAAGFMDEDRSQLPIRVPGLGQKGFPGRKGR
ncbi:hypothetical protein M0805_004937 [Coniferiporia weirii]|nr:hypothetical protein M0805_004937 [Coniferiporia weirii]